MTTNTDKECFTNSNDIITNCLVIFDQVKTSQKKYLKSSHGIARRAVDRLKCDTLPPEVNSAAYFDDLMKSSH